MLIIFSLETAMSQSTTPKLSPYAAQLAPYISEKLRENSTLTETQQRLHQRNWLTEKLRCDESTIKDGVTPVNNWVAFEDLDHVNPQHAAALLEIRSCNLPSKLDFDLIFSVMCHMNEKTVDMDKLCMPREVRIDAIREELLRPGKTNPPPGFAGDKSATWKHEVKKHWTMDGPVSQAVLKKCDKVPQIPLEKAYVIISENHYIWDEKKKENRHLGRDETCKRIRENRLTPGNVSIPTHIIKEFVNACPGCNQKTTVKARVKGICTTRIQGGNRGAKNPENSKKRKAESGPESDKSSECTPPSKKRLAESDPESDPESDKSSEYAPPSKDQLVSQSSHLRAPLNHETPFTGHILQSSYLPQNQISETPHSQGQLSQETSLINHISQSSYLHQGLGMLGNKNTVNYNLSRPSYPSQNMGQLHYADPLISNTYRFTSFSQQSGLFDDLNWDGEGYPQSVIDRFYETALPIQSQSPTEQSKSDPGSISHGNNHNGDIDDFLLSAAWMPNL